MGSGTDNASFYYKFLLQNHKHVILYITISHSIIPYDILGEMVKLKQYIIIPILLPYQLRLSGCYFYWTRYISLHIYTWQSESRTDSWVTLIQ